MSSGPAPGASDTRSKLTAAAADVLRTDGFAAVSARTIATRAGVNQALVFYHFGSVLGLVDVACRESVEAAVAGYRDQFAAVTSFVDLLRVGQVLHERERANGNVSLMAQLMAAAQNNELLARTARDCLARWNAELEPATTRLVASSVFAGVLDPAGLCHAITSGFLGIELYDGVDPAGAQHVMGTLWELGTALATLDALPPVAKRAVRGALRRKTGR